METGYIVAGVGVVVFILGLLMVLGVFGNKTTGILMAVAGGGIALYGGMFGMQSGEKKAAAAADAQDQALIAAERNAAQRAEQDAAVERLKASGEYQDMSNIQSVEDLLRS